MPSTRISLVSEVGFWRAFRIDREKPGIVQQFMSDSEWEEFCDKIDKAMQPLDQTAIFSKLITLLLSLSLICLPIAYMVNRRSLPIWTFIPPAVFFFITLIIPSNMQRKTDITKEDVQKVLSNYTAQRQPQLSFNLKFNNRNSHRHHRRRRHERRSTTAAQYYIQVYVNPLQTVEASYVEEGTQHPSSSSCPVYNHQRQQDIIYDTYEDSPSSPSNRSDSLVTAVATQLSPATRLEELEKVKHMLSKEEYTQKRSQILDEL